MTSVPYWVRTWWVRVPEPRDISALFTVVYAISAVTGFVVLFDPPILLLGVSDQVAVSLISICLMVGAVISCFAGWREYWKLERIGLWFLFGAQGMYFFLVTYLHLTSITGSRLLQMGTILVAVCCYVARYLLIRTFTYRPGAKQ